MNRKPTLSETRIGQSALITGASSGLGRELAIAFSQTGHVILSGRSHSGLVQTKEACKDPGNTTTVCGSLNDIEIRTRLAAYADLYRMRFLICCAGEYLRGLLETTDAEKLRSVLDTNLTDTISVVRSAYATLTQRKDGGIILINSTAGKLAPADEPIYAASKFGLTGFAQALGQEARARGIRVLTVFVGGMRTPMLATRPDHDQLMDPAEIAETIYNIAMNPGKTLQVQDITLGRFRQ